MFSKRVYLRKEIREESLHKIVSYLDNKLPKDCEIYPKPFLNGLYPDLLVMRPNYGIYIYEFSDSLPVGHTKLSQINRDIRSQYCPLIGSEREPYPGVITANIISNSKIEDSPDTDKEQSSDDTNEGQSSEITIKDIKKEILGLYNKRYRKLYTLNEYINNDIAETIFTKKNYHFREKHAKQLRCWLRPSDFRLEDMSNLPSLDKKQQSIVDSSSPSGIRGIKGAAGSGKTLVFVHKAIKALREGKKVLFLTFNITLINYIELLLRRGMKDESDENKNKFFDNLEINWYHRWANYYVARNFTVSEKEELIEIQRNIVSNDTSQDQTQWIHIGLPNTISKILEARLISKQDFEKYDLILVDEAQDFKLSWWESLKLVSTKTDQNGQIYLAGDTAQDIYFRNEMNKSNKLKQFGLRGWTTLNASYRLPKNYLPFINDFHNTFLKDGNESKPTEIPSDIDMFEECKAFWINVEKKDDTVDKCLSILLKVAPMMKEFAYSSAIILVDRAMDGAKIRDNLIKRKIKVADIFHSTEFYTKKRKPTYKEEEEIRKKKIEFNITKEPVKINTIYSFKGIEAPFLIIQITEEDNPKKIYTALTRLRLGMNSKCHVYVVNSAKKYIEYGKTWS
jgi:hypothetical protein